MAFEQTVQFLIESLSGVRAKAHVSDVARFHRIQASPGYDEAIDFIRDALGRIGVDRSISSFPADGRTETYGWTAPIGWRIRSGRLRSLEPEARLLCSYDDVAISVLGQSAAGRANGELVHIGKGTAPGDVEGTELEGRFVLTCGQPREILRRIRGRKAVGLVLYPDSERAAASYDLVQYAGLFPKADELEATPMGFSISRRAADRLIAQLAKGPVQVEGEIDADYFSGSMQVLEAEVPGTDPTAGAVLLVAHLCHPHPSANDNASGSGLLIEVARSLNALRRERPLRNAVRFLWVPEFNGALPWAAANAERLRDVQFVVNLDMVGQSPEMLGEPLRVFRVPNVRPSYLNACFEPILTRVGADGAALSSQGSRRPLHWIVDVPSGGSDHLVFQASPHALPAAMFGHDDPYWHTDLDTIDKVDPTRLKHVGLATALLAALPTWALEEGPRLAGWLLGFSGREMARAADLSRKMERARGRRLVAVAAAIERARGEALHRLIGDRGWDVARHENALAGIEEAVAGPSSGASVVSDACPERSIDGPVRFEIVETLNDDERAFVEEKLSAHHRAVIESLVNLCDGARDADEIALRLTLDFGAPFSVADTERSVELLTKTGYLST